MSSSTCLHDSNDLLLDVSRQVVALNSVEDNDKYSLLDSITLHPPYLVCTIWITYNSTDQSNSIRIELRSAVHSDEDTAVLAKILSFNLEAKSEQEIALANA